MGRFSFVLVILGFIPISMVDASAPIVAPFKIVEHSSCLEIRTQLPRQGAFSWQRDTGGRVHTNPEHKRFIWDVSQLRFEPRQNRVGQLVAMVDPFEETPLLDQDGYRRPRVLMAVLNVAASTSASIKSGCAYVSGGIDLESVSRGRCVWIDEKSRGAGGKPYCL